MNSSGMISVSAVFIAVAASAPAGAQVRGIYSPGSTLTQAGTFSDPGFGYINQLWYYSASRLSGPAGNTLPVTGSITIAADNNVFSYVPKLKLLGANMQFSADLTLSKGNYTASDPLLSPTPFLGGGVGLTNTDIVPFSLGWHRERVDVQAAYSFYIPTGRYHPGASNNVSTGYWSNALESGATLYLTKNKAMQLSLFDAYTWNTVQRGTGIRPGQNNSLDYSLTQQFTFGKWSLQAGPAGYGQWQTTRNQGQSLLREALKYSINGAGFTTSLAAPHGITLGLSALWEYRARNTYKGHTIVITAAFPL
jgi:hypothetical protein